MNKDQLYKLNKKVELEEAFKPFAEQLAGKYNTEFSIQVHYDTLLLSGVLPNLRDDAVKIREELINYEELQAPLFLSILFKKKASHPHTSFHY